jgi:hypothetical protein
MNSRIGVTLTILALFHSVSNLKAERITKLLDESKAQVGQLVGEQGTQKPSSGARVRAWRGYSPLPALALLTVVAVAVIAFRNLRRRSLTPSYAAGPIPGHETVAAASTAPDRPAASDRDVMTGGESLAAREPMREHVPAS